MTSFPKTRLKAGAIEAVLDTVHVTPATRRALLSRLEWTGASPRCFDTGDFATLKAICDELVPQPDGKRRVDLAARLDAALADGTGDGWRYDALPEDRRALVLGVRGIDQSALAGHGVRFVELSPTPRRNILAEVQRGSAPGEIWQSMPAQLFFKELLARLAELYYAHPYAQERIGYIGMADAEGFQALGLNHRDPIEDWASDAPA